MNRSRIAYGALHDKIYGCWIGKTLGGTMGAPYEGIKMPMNLEYDPKMLDVMLPNDDLDLQLLWMDVLEKKGIDVTPRDLLRHFAERCDYSPGEYAVMRKNYMKGIYPPLSGQFSNDFYAEGMGSPIRSEIWACLFPGNPGLAADMAVRDAQLDHTQASIDGERFFAAMESAAFFESDPHKLVETGLQYVTPGSKLYRVITDTVGWAAALDSPRAVLNKILAAYGHPDCTNVFQNIGIILLALFHGGGDFIKTNMIAINAGFDTDCTAATVSSLLGIIHGSAYFNRIADIGNLQYVLGVRLEREDKSIRALAAEVAALACAFDTAYGLAAAIDGKPDLPPPAFDAEAITATYAYDGPPSIDFDTPCRVTIRIRNRTGEMAGLRYTLKSQTGLLLTPADGMLTVPPGGTADAVVEVSVPEDAAVLMEKNLIDLLLYQGDHPVLQDVFGVSGAAVYKLSGPFWKTTPSLSDDDIRRQPYFNYLGGSDKAETFDNIRNFHINFSADSHLGRPAEGTLFEPFDPARVSEDFEQSVVSLAEDSFEMTDLFGLQGACVAYLSRMLYVPEDTECCLQIGHSDGIALWINGELLLEREDTDFFTSENSHLTDIRLNKGMNTLALRLTRRSMRAKYSLVFSTEPTCAEHIIDYGSVNPRYFGRLSGTAGEPGDGQETRLA